MIKKKILFSTIAILGASTAVYAWENPIKQYNLYADTHREQIQNAQDGNYERAMSDYYNNSNNSSSNNISPPSDNLNYGSQASTSGKRRNEVLRESSRRVYANNEEAPAWTKSTSFYPNPSLQSIKEKYRKSNFTGCLQECESYVKSHPRDSLGFYYLAMCYSKVSDRDNAIRAYEKVISLHANPMIVKYATNGRNCILGGSETCYPNINQPDLLHPYANIAGGNLTPVDPQTLIDRNMAKLEQKLSPQNPDGSSNQNGEGNSADPNAPKLPFANQDEELDKFIKAPYGNGLSPTLDKEYKQMQLRKFQQTINSQDGNPEKEFNQKQDIKKFDNEHSDSNEIKIAYEFPKEELDKLSKDPEYLQTKRELQDLRMMLGVDSEKSDEDDVLELLKNYSKDGEKLSPEMIEAIMVKEMMPDFTFVNSKDIL